MSTMVTIDTARFDALIFDLDGVITRTASIHARAWKKLFDQFLAQRAAQTGAPFVPFDSDLDYRRYVDGKPRIAGLLSFLAARHIDVPVGQPGDEAGGDSAHALARRKDRYFSELLTQEGVEGIASTVAFVREARRRGLRLAVASSSHHCAEILKAAGLADLFDARVDGVDIDRLHLIGKPAPDMFVEAAHRLGRPPQRAVVFEDATAGVAAAHAGGFGLVIGIGRGQHASALIDGGADAVIADLGEVNLLPCRKSP
jgi:beta-phosphoglucomutase family hydrolase